MNFKQQRLYFVQALLGLLLVLCRRAGVSADDRDRDGLCGLPDSAPGASDSRK